MGSVLLAAMAPMHMLAKHDDANGSTGTEEPPVEPRGPLVKDHPVVATESIEIKKLKLDAGTQPRVSIDEGLVNHYAEIIKEAIKAEQPIPFPAIDVFRDPTGMTVPVDGFHRIAAHRKAGVKEILCDIREGTLREAIVFAAGANATHGLQRNSRDIRRVIRMFLGDPEWAKYSNTEIAAAAKVSEWTVRDERKLMKPSASSTSSSSGSTRVDKKGRKINVSKIGKGGGNERAKKAAAKRAKKSGDAPPNGSGESATTHQLSREIMKIATGLGDEKGGKVRRAIEEGALPLRKPQILAWAGMSKEDMRRIEPLVTGEDRMDPWKALEFLKEPLPEKMVHHLHRLAIGNGGTFEFASKGIKIVVTHTGK